MLKSCIYYGKVGDFTQLKKRGRLSALTVLEQATGVGPAVISLGS